MLVSKDLNFSVHSFEVTVGVIAQSSQGLFRLVAKPWVPSSRPTKLCGAHTCVRCTWEVEAGRREVQGHLRLHSEYKEAGLSYMRSCPQNAIQNIYNHVWLTSGKDVALCSWEFHCFRQLKKPKIREVRSLLPPHPRPPGKL